MHTMEFQKCWKTVADWIIIQIFNVADIPNKKNSIFFQNFFQFFCFLTSFSNKKIFFALLGQITYFYIRVGQHVHLTPPKCFLKAYSTHCPQNAPQIWIFFGELDTQCYFYLGLAMTLSAQSVRLGSLLKNEL